MPSAKHFVLIGNYPADRQESMLRFAGVLAQGLSSRGMSVETIAPQSLLARRAVRPGNPFQKWLAYADKWTFFPAALRRFVQKKERQFGARVFYHVCDHSNAPYLALLPPNRSAITCHDVLAIRGALGYPESYCAASRTGVLLQRWILKHLSRAPRIGCVSRLTLRHLCEVSGQPNPKPGWTVLPNAFNADFGRIESGKARQILEQQNLSVPQPYLLHVGSNLPRKNRRLLLQMISQPKQPWFGHLCFAGEPPDATLLAEAQALGLANRMHTVPKPDHETLCALYSLAHAFVFPSLSEGFGWPLIEAQACGAPVIASALDPLPEVSGGAALHADPHSAARFAAALQSLNDPRLKNSLVENGFQNARRYDLATMIDGYLSLHGLNRSGECLPS